MHAQFIFALRYLVQCELPVPRNRVSVTRLVHFENFFDNDLPIVVQRRNRHGSELRSADNVVFRVLYYYYYLLLP